MNSRKLRGTPTRMPAHPSLPEPGGSPGDEGRAAERCRRITLDAGAPSSVGTARRAVADALREWGLSPLAEDVTLCVSELVSNAVEHTAPRGRTGRGAVAVALRAWPTWLFLEVSDEDPRPPSPATGVALAHDLSAELPDSPLADRGRGLFIVTCLADATWWARRAEGGKSVFCRFDLARAAA
ncbi:ATP-binding protein [Streptomyces zingiberis]|uniref:ATP-binding protein n=1 Tax=Streptomyces zingiberis TaxID=2053010 RepID=A0ABX1C6E6_9ACTN|nr:ATP-binding protein [Streptomyces zingiberis]NJQ03487.1 ATP-binding protein [Streptomyces zingiberis]